MKTKKFQKKLTFNKQTVVDLNIDEMADIHGGGDAPLKSLVIIHCTFSCENPWC